jgi:hypothetical protein
VKIFGETKKAKKLTGRFIMATKKTTNTEKTEALDFVQSVMISMGDKPIDAGNYETNVICGGNVIDKEVKLLYPSGKEIITSDLSYGLYKGIFDSMKKTVDAIVRLRKGEKIFTAGDSKKCKIVHRSIVEFPNEIEDQVNGFINDDKIEVLETSKITKKDLYDASKSIGFVTFFIYVEYMKQGSKGVIKQWFKMNIAINKKQQKKENGANFPLKRPKGDSF